MTAPFVLPPLPEWPTITVRSAHYARRGGVHLVLTPGRPCVAIDDHQLEPEDARALGAAIGDMLGADNVPGELYSADRDALHGGLVGAAVRDGVLLLSISADGEHRELWRGPLSDGLDIALGLLNAGTGALDVLRYSTRPLFVVSPFAPGMSGPH